MHYPWFTQKKKKKDMTPKLRPVGLIDSFLIKINKLSLTKKKKLTSSLRIQS